MAKKVFAETTFGSQSRLPVNVAASHLTGNVRAAPGTPVLLVAESPQRHSAASAWLWVGVAALGVLVVFSLAAAFSQAVEWSWGVGSLFAAGTLIGFGLGVNRYYSFGGVQDLVIIVFQSGQNLVALEEPWWFQATEKLRYLVFKGAASYQFVVSRLDTKAGGESGVGAAIAVDLVVQGQLTTDEEASNAWLRKIEAEAMQSGQDSAKILTERLKQLSATIRGHLKQLFEPLVVAKTYRGLRNKPEQVVDQAELAQVAKDINERLAGTPLRFESLVVAAVIPPLAVAEQEEREAARLEQEQKLLAELEGKVAAVPRGQTAKLRSEIKAVDISDEAREKLQTNLEKRRQALEASYLEQMISAVTLTTANIVAAEIAQADLPSQATVELSAELDRKVDLLQEQAMAVEQAEVSEREEDLGLELRAVLALSSEGGKFAPEIEEYVRRKKERPEQLNAALEIRRLRADRQQRKALKAPNPNNGAASDGRDPEVEARIEGVIKRLETVTA